MTEKERKIPQDVLKITEFLKSTASALKVRNGVLAETRVRFFKGKHLENALLREAYQKTTNNPQIPDRQAAEKYGQLLCDHQIILRVKKEPGQKRLEPIQENLFSSEDYFIWIYQGSQVKSHLTAFGVLVLIFIGVLYPVWPNFMRQGLYYVSMASMGFLAFLLTLGVIRLIVWLVLVVSTGRGGWLFPNLFADCGVIESFKPLWG